MSRQSALKLIEKYYSDNTEAMNILVPHAEAVADKAFEIARALPHLNPDMAFIEEAAILHDMGIIKTNAPNLGCHGESDYMCHGVKGRAMLEAEGLPLHALVCERHIGVGLTVADIRANGFPLPERDMVPLSVEEKIICLADKFFSKSGSMQEKTFEVVRASIAKFGDEKLRELDELMGLLLPDH